MEEQTISMKEQTNFDGRTDNFDGKIDHFDRDEVLKVHGNMHMEYGPILIAQATITKLSLMV